MNRESRPPRGGISLRAIRRPLLIALAYFCVALALTWPAATTLTTRFIGGDTSDVHEMARHIWWLKHALANGDDPFYHALLAYPDGFGVVQPWAYPLQFFPMWLFAFVLPLPAAYNLGAWLTMTLNGLAMYCFARLRISRLRRVPALMAGLVFMAYPTIQGHLFAGHLGLLSQWQAPLLLLSLYAYVEKGRKRWLVVSTLLFWLAALGHSLQWVYLLSPLFALFILARLARRDYVGATRALAVAAFGSALLLLFLAPILGETLQTAQYRAAGGHARYSIDLLSLATPSFMNPFWRDIATHSPGVLGSNLGEGVSYIGVVGGLLMLVGVMTRRAARWWLLLAFVAWLLALGPVLKLFDEALTPEIAGYSTVIPLPFAALMQLPGLELARTPGRFMFLFALAAAVMAGYGMTTLWSSRLFQRRKPLLRYGWALLLALAVIGDYRFFAPFPTLPAAIPKAIHDLRQRNDIRAVYNAPHDHLLAAKEAMYLQTAHAKPLIAGQDTRVTPVDPAKLELLASFQPALLKEAGADIVIINIFRARELGELDTLLTTARRMLGAPVYADERYAMYEVGARRQLPSAPIWMTSSDKGSHDIYVYKAQAGWLELSAQLDAVDRRVSLSLNGVPLQSREVIGPTALSLPLPIARRGYSTLSIALDPPCPDHIDTAVLLCHSVSLESVELSQLSRGAIYDPIRIAGGIELAGWHMATDERDNPVIHLWWRFDSPRAAHEQRFVHLLDEERRLMRQDDISFGAAPAGSDHLESVRLDISDFAPGEYLALTGWYSLPAMLRYDVLTDVEGAQDNTIALGAITVTD